MAHTFRARFVIGLGFEAWVTAPGGNVEYLTPSLVFTLPSGTFPNGTAVLLSVETPQPEPNSQYMRTSVPQIEYANGDGGYALTFPVAVPPFDFVVTVKAVTAVATG